MTESRNGKVSLQLDFDFEGESVLISHVEGENPVESRKNPLLTLGFAELKGDSADPKLFEKIVFGTCIHLLHPENHQGMSASEWEDFMAGLREEAELGDAEAALRYATALAQYALISKDEHLLDEAEIFYATAAKKNSPRAKAYLSGPWQFTKDFYREKIRSEGV
jgi:hypothetical protein